MTREEAAEQFDPSDMPEPEVCVHCRNVLGWDKWVETDDGSGDALHSYCVEDYECDQAERAEAHRMEDACDGSTPDAEERHRAAWAEKHA